MDSRIDKVLRDAVSLAMKDRVNLNFEYVVLSLIDNEYEKMSEVFEDYIDLSELYDYLEDMEEVKAKELFITKEEFSKVFVLSNIINIMHQIHDVNDDNELLLLLKEQNKKMQKGNTEFTIENLIKALLFASKGLNSYLQEIGLDKVIFLDDVEIGSYKDLENIMKEPFSDLEDSEEIEVGLNILKLRNDESSKKSERSLKEINPISTAKPIKRFSTKDLKEENSKEKLNDRWKKGLITDLREEVKSSTNKLIGRNAEIDDTIRVLCRKTKNNPIHIGEPGVGKTAIIYELARMINEGKVSNKLKDCKIYSLTMGDLLAGARFRGDVEEKLKTVIENIEKEDNCILYIDEIHTIVGAGGNSDENTNDVSNILKPYLAKENKKCKIVGSTTFNEYKRYIQKDGALSRRFQPVIIKEPSKEDTYEIIKGIAKSYEDFHKVKYTEEALKAIVDLSIKYMNDKFLPDKAIDLLDEAGATISKDTTEKVKRAKKITELDIEKLVAKKCNIPEERIGKKEGDALSKLEEKLSKRVFGQDEAIKAIVKKIKLKKAGLIEDNKPIGSFLLVGPTGVGKTEVAKALADNLGVDLIKYDMSEYMEQHSVSKLIGSPAGYVGYDDGAKLVDDIRKHPSCVLLLDEIEKAHAKVFDILLQVLDDAVLTDNKGFKADFKNVIILMTSNAGASNINGNNGSFGFSNLNEKENEHNIIIDKVQSAVKETFRPEFLNRLSQIVVFNSMDEDMAKRIIDKELKNFNEMLKNRNVNVTCTDTLKKYILENGVSKEYGAREIKRVIDVEVKDLLVDELLFGALKKGGKCTIDFADKLLLTVK